MNFVKIIGLIVSVLLIITFILFWNSNKSLRKTIHEDKIVIITAKSNLVCFSNLVGRIIAYKLDNGKLPHTLEGFDVKNLHLADLFYSPKGFKDQEGISWLIVYNNKAQNNFIVGKIKDGKPEIRIIENDLSLAKAVKVKKQLNLDDFSEYQAPNSNR